MAACVCVCVCVCFLLPQAPLRAWFSPVQGYIRLNIYINLIDRNISNGNYSICLYI